MKMRMFSFRCSEESEFMKVKVKRHKKSPAPLVAEQVISIMAKSEPNLYSAVQKAVYGKDLAKKGLVI